MQTYLTETDIEYYIQDNFFVFIKNNSFNHFDLLGYEEIELDIESTEENSLIRLSFIVNEKRDMHNRNFDEINRGFGKFKDKTEYVIYMRVEELMFKHNMTSLIDLFVKEYNRTADSMEPESKKDEYICPF